MFLSFLLFIGFLQVVTLSAQEISVVRHIDGDIFTVRGSCSNACSDLSSSTASPYRRQTLTSSNGATASSSTVNATCVCQCKSSLHLFREDLNICVNDIPECSVTGFVSSSGLVEKIPYVFLPQRGQIIYPQAEIQFQGVTTPVCGIAGAQQLGKSGWSEFRNLSSIEIPFKLFKDQERTFLQWVGESGLRDAAEGKVVIVRLVCRDASPNPINPGVFTPCVAFRVAGSPSKSNTREVTFMSTAQPHQGLSTIEYTAIGISSVLLALIYIASVSLYLHSRKSRRKIIRDPETVISSGRESSGIIKNNPLLKHFESADANSLRSESDNEELSIHDEVNGFKKITSAVIHSCVGMLEQPEGSFGSSIIAERLPEEDVRIVETADNQQDISVLPGVQRRKLYFNPAYFDRQLLMAPPPAAIEFLLKIREVISIAKHKLAAKRFIPTLSAISEEEVASDRCSSSNKRPGSVQSSVTKLRKSQKCSGCPGCLESRKNNLSSALPDNSRPIPGESRVRAWLEDIKPPERLNWGTEENHKIIHENFRSFAKSLEYLKDVRKDLLKIDQTKFDRNSPTSWKNNPPMLKTLHYMAKSEILGDDDRNSISQRSTKSMFEDTNYDRFCRTRRCNLQDKNADPNDVVNEKIRKAIENSFIKQMEENAAIENQMIEKKNQSERFSPDGSSENNLDSFNSIKKGIETLGKKKKCKAPEPPVRELPDMINELPSSKLQAKKIMDAVIKEMVDVKALDHHAKLVDIDYEVDSLERTNKQKLNVKKKNHHNSNSDDKDIEVEKNHENNNEIMRKNYYNNLPELISSRSEGYSLVSEVYVNDGYASPANSDDSGPEICYEPEQPGHLTIKVQDSPENYVKCDESEYEPDTLDRKPMKLKINGDVIYDKEPANEIYVDSLERPAHIMLRSKSSFRDDLSRNGKSLSRGYGSLREIYEARLRSNVEANLETGSLNEKYQDSPKNTLQMKSKYLTPELRQARRQRKKNQPDVVPLPPEQNIYEHPKSPRPIDDSRIHQKNEWDRSAATDAGDPTASRSPPVSKNNFVGTRKRRGNAKTFKKIHSYRSKYEDSGYLSSTDDSTNKDNNKLNKQTLKYDFGSVSETDETESICDGASESGAESIGTDSVFFGNFRKLSNASHSKSMDSGIDFKLRNFYYVGSETEGHTHNPSDSENESFITVLPYNNKSRSNLGS
ncbi:uncharacterized protein sha [Chelonus insularis]|uniref:uncharacterized protein sha n=1 Tax=Chelonus insularis TaxID=460826 RepID=UPI0015894548|nr:uncharacterized protein LOC118070796 [Chelonus insularis]